MKRAGIRGQAWTDAHMGVAKVHKHRIRTFQVFFLPKDRIHMSLDIYNHTRVEMYHRLAKIALRDPS